MFKVLCFLAVVAASTLHAAPIDSMKLRFKISARDLPDKDTLGTIDPYVEIFSTDEGTKEEVTVGRSATLTDQENPDWGDVFEFEFVRAKRQRWHFKVYDHDNAREDDKAGQAYVDVADYVDKNQHLNVNLNKKGFLILSTVDPVPVTAAPAPAVPAQVQLAQVAIPGAPGVATVPIVSSVPTHVLIPQTGGPLIVPQPQTVIVPEKAKLRFKLSAKGLPDKDKFGTIDPYVELYYTEGASTQEKKFGKSATIDNNNNPQWGDVFEFDYDRSKQQKWLFKIYDHDQGREDDSGGKVWVDVNDFVQKGQAVTVNLSKKGTLTLANANPEQATAPAPNQPQVVAPYTQQVVVPVAPVPQSQPVHPHLVQVPQVPVVHPHVVQAPQPQVVQVPVVQTPSPITKIKFRLSAKGLEDKDIYGTSDPHVKIFSKIGSEPEVLIGSTAKLSDTENPVWPDTFDYEYDANKQPKLRFLVLDEDDGRRDDELGEAWLNVNEYVQKNQDMKLSLTKGTLSVSKA